MRDTVMADTRLNLGGALGIPHAGTGIAFSLAVAAAFLAFFWGRPINHDTAWYLIATREWLDGARLYRDIYEVNPPLNFYFTVPPVLLADLTDLAPSDAQYVVIAAAIFLSLTASWLLLPGDGKWGAGRRLFFLAGLALAMILPAINDTGQREQIMVILCTPWLVAGLPRPAPLTNGQRIGVGLAAGLGICLKPFFLLVPLFVTLWHVAARSPRPILSATNLAMGAVGIAYVGAALLLHPEYFRDVIPVARDVYGAIRVSDPWVRIFLVVAVAPYVLFGLLLPLSRAIPAGTGLFVAAALAGVGAYILQWNGFPYHTIPIAAFATMACAWVIARTPQVTPLVCAAAIGLAGTVLLGGMRGPYADPVPGQLASELDPAWAPDGVMVLSTEVTFGPPLAARLHARWTSRYPHSWLIPGALNGLARTDCNVHAETCQRLAALLDRSRGEYVEDIVRGKPDLLVVHKAGNFIDDPDFSWYEIMADAPGWEDAIADYRQVKSTPAFDIWLRCTDAAAAIALSCAATRTE